jgi:hypothetical protein
MDTEPDPYPQKKDIDPTGSGYTNHNTGPKIYGTCMGSITSVSRSIFVSHDADAPRTGKMITNHGILFLNTSTVKVLTSTSFSTFHELPEK